ncbi:MAG: DUF2721 domain-containing protein [Opitutae bacterium]|nr:DUF2721 domain-containing protein [Opitutae bacterium]
MDALPSGSLLPIIQFSITPVILLSGVGALLLSLTNRMGRIVDRTRILAGQARTTDGADRQLVETQIAIMWRRARLMRLSVTLAGGSMLVSCLLVVVIFAGALLRRDLDIVIMGFFACSLGLIIAALVTFLRDLFLSLEALDVEIRRAQNQRETLPH